MADVEKIEAPEAPVSPEATSLDEAQLDSKPQDEKKNKYFGGDKFRWYVIQAFSGFEQRVALTLQERIKIHHMEDYFGEILVPKEKVKEIKDGKKRESERKFFPGYVLVNMRMTSESWQLVKHTDRVLGFIGGTSEKPLPITEAEANKILDRLKETEDSPRPKTMFEVGEHVVCIITQIELKCRHCYLCSVRVVLILLESDYTVMIPSVHGVHTVAYIG